MQVNYPKVNSQYNLKKTSFKSNKNNNEFVSIDMPLPHINNCLMGLSLFNPIISSGKNTTLSYLGILGIGMINSFLPNHKEIIEVDKRDSKDIAIKKHFIKKQGFESLILTASSLLTANSINENKCSSTAKNIQIANCIVAWGISILNNILGYKNYKDKCNCANGK
ncbi:MAG: hypothetical protein BHW64_04515 [Candidatus Melainabacteria bacterium LEY3_CP_29_8]|nr:MAG: hypothetical protein BHW64_04515 [Candidatus Melainabacteria bacterium LEY3_CP_29_8]